MSRISVKNFRQINNWFYRGGQPLLEEFGQLKDLGVKTVVCLRWNRRIIEEEKEIVTSNDIEFISIPLNYWRLPNNKEISTYFNIIENIDRRPVYLHCKHGSDRTGMLAAFYRIKHEGWSADKAYEEMKDAGFHKIRMHHFKFAVYLFAKRDSSH